jgi:hypothetical protein
MAIPKKVLEWRKTHVRTLEEQTKPQKTLEELKEQWLQCQTNLTNLLERIRSRENN